MTTTTLQELQRPADYLSGGRTHIFPTLESFKWWTRNHRNALIQRGALVKVANRVFVVAPPMDQAVVELGATAMQEAA